MEAGAYSCSSIALKWFSQHSFRIVGFPENFRTAMGSSLNSLQSKIKGKTRQPYTLLLRKVKLNSCSREDRETRSLNQVSVIRVPCWVVSDWLLKLAFLTPSSFAEWWFKLCIQNFIPLLVCPDLKLFLVCSDLNPVLSELINQSQMTKITVVNFNKLKMLL